MKFFSTFLLFMILIFSGCGVKNPQIITPQTCKISGFYEFDPKFSKNKIWADNYTIINLLLASIDKYEGTRKGGDCSGFIELLNSQNHGVFFNRAELDKYFTNGKKSQAMYNYFKAKGRISMTSPQIGDLIFWQNTTRKTRGKKTGEITHVGVIREIFKDGRIRFVHYGSRGNTSDFMDLNRPNTHIMGKKVVNSYIASCKNKNFCLASNLFVGFGKVVE